METLTTHPPMKSCFALLLSLVASIAILGSGALLWYLSDTAEFTRQTKPPAPTSAMPPKATPIHPPAKR
jgi:hypothetical protein